MGCEEVREEEGVDAITPPVVLPLSSPSFVVATGTLVSQRHFQHVV